MHAVGSVQVDLLAAGDIRGFNHLIDIRRTEVLAGVAVLSDAAGVADVSVVNHEMRWLIFLMFGAGVIKVRKLVESYAAIAFGRAKQVLARSAIRGQFRQFFEPAMSGA